MSFATAGLYRLVPNHPILTVAGAMDRIGTTEPTATRPIETLVTAGVLVEITGRKRDRRFAYDNYLSLLRGDTASSDNL